MPSVSECGTGSSMGRSIHVAHGGPWPVDALWMRCISKGRRIGSQPRRHACMAPRTRPDRIWPRAPSCCASSPKSLTSSLTMNLEQQQRQWAEQVTARERAERCRRAIPIQLYALISETAQASTLPLSPYAERPPPMQLQRCSAWTMPCHACMHAHAAAAVAHRKAELRVRVKRGGSTSSSSGSMRAALLPAVFRPYLSRGR